MAVSAGRLRPCVHGFMGRPVMVWVSPLVAGQAACRTPSSLRKAALEVLPRYSSASAVMPDRGHTGPRLAPGRRSPPELSPNRWKWFPSSYGPAAGASGPRLRRPPFIPLLPLAPVPPPAPGHGPRPLTWLPVRPAWLPVRPACLPVPARTWVFPALSRGRASGAPRVPIGSRRSAQCCSPVGLLPRPPVWGPVHTGRQPAGLRPAWSCGTRPVSSNRQYSMMPRLAYLGPFTSTSCRPVLGEAISITKSGRFP